MGRRAEDVEKSRKLLEKAKLNNKTDEVEIFEKKVRSGQVWGYTPEQRVTASTLRRYSFGHRLAIAQADARPAMPVFFR